MISRMMDTTFKLLLVLFAIIVVVILMLRINTVFGEVKDSLLSSGDLTWFIYVSALGLLIGYVVKKLLLWEVHATFGNPHRRK